MSIFNWFRQKEENQNITKQPRRSPALRNYAEAEQVNSGLTQGLWHNSYPGMRLAGGLVFMPLAVPVWLMGYPSVKTDNPFWDNLLNGFIGKNTSLLANLHLQVHRDGTVWVYPFWNADKQEVLLDIIPDDIVSKVVIDPLTGQLISLEADELIVLDNGAQVRRKRRYTQDEVVCELDNKTIRKKNRYKILPVLFTNNADAGEWHGYSDLERIIPDLKDYNDIDAARSLMLAKFNAKMVQTVEDVDVWLNNNGYDSLLDIDIAKTDLIFNTHNEKTDFVFPNNATTAYSEALKQKFRKIVEASGVPEIAWGLKTEGNKASVEENMQALVMYVRNKQQQKTDAYCKIITYAAKLYSGALLRRLPKEIKVSWNELSALSAETRAAIFQQNASAMGALVSNAAITKQQLYKMWQMLYPDATAEDLQGFVEGISDMAAHWQWRNASYMDTMDFDNDKE